MGTPITKAATVMCDLGGKVNLSAVSSKIKIDGNDVVDAADIGLPMMGCPGHPPGQGPPCTLIQTWNIKLNSLHDAGEPVVGAGPGQVAMSDVPIAVITCSNPGNSKFSVD